MLRFTFIFKFVIILKCFFFGFRSIAYMRKGIWQGMGVMFCVLTGGLSLFAQLEKRLPFPVFSFQLNNGLNVILSEDNSLPLVTVAVAYKAGSKDEPAGQSGLAYLLQNLMFEGSRNIGRMQHLSFIQRIGGRLNAQTERDHTIFYQTVPSHHLASVLWLESDRMMSLTIHQTNVDYRKNQLAEDLKARRLQDPYMDGAEIFESLLYPDHAYGRPVHGREADLQDIRLSEVKSFYDIYYRPNNAVLCIVGNIDLKQAQELVLKYFQSISPGRNNSTSTPTNKFENTHIQAITDSVTSPLAIAPGFFLGYRIPKARSDDFYALKLIEYILFKGKSSRLHKRLLQSESLASQLSGGIEIRGDQAAFLFIVTSSNELKIERSQKEIFSEINKLKTTRISENELLKAKNVFKSEYLERYATTLDKALYLVNSRFSGMTREDLPGEMDKYLAVTPARIIYTMQKYFTQERILINVKTR